jgi:hypothetical protein
MPGAAFSSCFGGSVGGTSRLPLLGGPPFNTTTGALTRTDAFSRPEPRSGGALSRCGGAFSFPLPLKNGLKRAGAAGRADVRREDARVFVEVAIGSGTFDPGAAGAGVFVLASVNACVPLVDGIGTRLTRDGDPELRLGSGKLGRSRMVSLLSQVV